MANENPDQEKRNVVRDREDTLRDVMRKKSDYLCLTN